LKIQFDEFEASDDDESSPSDAFSNLEGDAVGMEEEKK